MIRCVPKTTDFSEHEKTGENHSVFVGLNFFAF